VNAETARLIILIAAYRAQHGTGPSWSIVSRAMGWSREETHTRLRLSLPDGVRWRHGDPGSLMVKKRGVEAAMLCVRAKREAA
jgi:hypothetical protein